MLSSLFCHYKTKYRKILVLVPSLYLVNQTYNTWIKYWDKKIIKRVSCEEGLSNDAEILSFSSFKILQLLFYNVFLHTLK